MRWWGAATRLETTSSGDTLEFRATSVRRLADLPVPIASSIGFVVGYCRHWNAGALLGLAALAAVPLWNWFRRTETILRVTERELNVAGDLGNSFEPGQLRLPWNEVGGLEYFHGGEDGPRGLHARKGRWTKECLLPYLDEEQATAVIHAIYRRFPYLEMADEGSGSGGVFGSGGEIFSLGLSGAPREK